MNKQKLRITSADLKRCTVAIAAVRKMANLKQCRRYSLAGQAANNLIGGLERLKLIYAGLVGVVLYPGIKIMPRANVRNMIGEVNQLFGFAYPADKAEEWRGQILKPIQFTLERLDWLEKKGRE